MLFNTLIIAPPYGIILPPGCPPYPPHHTNPVSSLHGVLRSPDRRLSPMPLPRLLPLLTIFFSLMVPPPSRPARLPSPPLPCIFQNIFYQDDERVKVENPKDQVIIRKENHGVKGYWVYCIHHFMNTSALDVKFGVAKHFFQRSCKV